MRTTDTQFNYLFEKIYELVELADFDIDDELIFPSELLKDESR